jgi:hypothetical protein
MRRLRQVRIVRWELKLAYAAGAWIIGSPIAWLLAWFGAPDAVLVLAGSVVTLAGFVVGARIFRGRGEPIEPPRPWWRMTARPTLSRRLGILFAVLAALSVMTLLLRAAGVSAAPGSTGPFETVVVTIETGILAYLYLNSATRLRSIPPPVEPSFRTRALR